VARRSCAVATLRVSRASAQQTAPIANSTRAMTMRLTFDFMFVPYDSF
jgi:hypothetical protein